MNTFNIRNNQQDSIKTEISFYRNKQSNHIRAMVSLWISFVFGLFSIDDFLVFIPFVILIIIIFFHFYDRYRSYLLVESVILHQIGKKQNSIVDSLGDKIPTRNDWWADKTWFNKFRAETCNKEGKLSIIYWWWFFTPKSRKSTGFLSLLWGGLIISRLFGENLNSIFLKNSYGDIKRCIIGFYEFFYVKEDYFFLTILLLLLLTMAYLLLFHSIFFWWKLNSEFNKKGINQTEESDVDNTNKNNSPLEINKVTQSKKS